MASFIKGLELDKQDLSGKFLAIREETSGDGNFCLTCLMWHCWSNPVNAACLLATHRGFNHYYHVGMKIGFNLSTQSKRAVVLELGKAFVDHETADPMFSGVGDCSDDSLKTLFLGIQKRIEEMKTSHQDIYLFLDNLSSLLYLGYTASQVKTFLYYLRTVVRGSVTAVVSTYVSPDDVEQLEVGALLWQVADMRIAVSPLRTGTSQDVSGSLELSIKNNSTIESWSNTLYHYKLTERNVKIFHPGNI